MMDNFWASTWGDLAGSIFNLVLSILLGFALLFVGLRLIRWIMHGFSRARFNQKMDPTAQSFLASLVSIGLKAVLIIAVAGVVGVPTASIIAVLGSAGVAIGLALQGSLSNLAGGFMLLLFKPFARGDYITLSGDLSGTVTDISVFYTTLLTVDQRKVMVPNGAVSNGQIINTTAEVSRRVEINFGVAYGTDIDRVRAALVPAAAMHPKVNSAPPPEVVLMKMGDSSLECSLRAYCNAADYLDLVFPLTEMVQKTLQNAGLEIPFPQLDVHVK